MSQIQQKQDKRGYTSFWLDGKRLPSVTTICSRWKDSGGLIYWANQQGLEGSSMQEAQTKAVTPGSIVHEMIECEIRAKTFEKTPWDMLIAAEHLDPAEIWGKVELARSSFTKWASDSRLKPAKSELSLASEKYRFGGTLDAVLMGDEYRILDFKTGKLYPDHILQIAGYVILWEDQLKAQALSGVDLLSISKEFGTFTHMHIPRLQLGIAVDQFLALRECYDRDNLLKKML